MTIVELYDDREIARLSRRIRSWTAAIGVLAAAALAVCVTLAALTNTANAGRMELAAIAVSTLAGWVIIYCSLFVVTEGRRELGHARMLREEERERVEGQIAVTKERLIIRKSIRVRRVLDSVVVHELCHLKELNHSPAFYAQVYRVFPDYDRCRTWLRENGGALLRRLGRP